ncbi:MAG: large conductance mechanosensitive channel protein MscL [Gammaproteobacteria bacterium]
MKKFFADFRAFMNRGNIMDMAVGIAVGGAFTIVVKSLVSNVIMPPIGLAIGNVNFRNLFWVLKAGKTPGPYHTADLAQKAGAVTLNYGTFVNDVISFLIIGFAVFMLVRYISKLEGEFTPKEEPAAPTTKACPRCCSTIPLAATRCPNCTSELGAA